MRQRGFLITFSEANWMVANQSLRQRKTIPSNATIMLTEDVTEYLDADPDYYDDYGPKFGLPWDRIKWLYWIKNRFSVGPQGGVFFLGIETNLEWTIDMSSVPSWISIPTADRSGTTDKEIQLTATKNESINNDRTANIRMTVGGKQYTHTLTQEKTPVTTIIEEFTLHHIDSTYNSITFGTNDLPLYEGDIEIAYRKGDMGDWIPIDMPIGPHPLEWTIDGLEDGESYQIRATTIRGQGTETVINYESNIITASTIVEPYMNVNITSKTVNADVTSFTFAITSNTQWSISDNRDWISVSPSSGSGNRTVTVTLQQNYEAQRSGTITITSPDTATKTISVTQRAIALVATSFLGTGTMVGEYEGADTAWDAISNNITYNAYATHAVFQIGTRVFHDVLANTPVDGKSQWYRQGDNVVQIGPTGLINGIIPIDDVEDPNPPDPVQNGITPPALLFPAAGGRENIQITALNNAAWVASTDGLGVQLNDSFGNVSGNGNSQITVSVPQNFFDQIVMFEVTVNISGVIYRCSCTQAPGGMGGFSAPQSFTPPDNLNDIEITRKL